MPILVTIELADLARVGEPVTPPLGCFGDMNRKSKMISDYDPKLTSIILDWDTNGSIRHRFEDVVKHSFAERRNILAMSVPVLVSSQLGVISVNRALALSHHLLMFLRSGEIAIEPINSALKGSMIDLYKGKNIYQLFFPHANSSASNDSIEDGIKQMLCNYVWHVNSIVSNKLERKIKLSLLMSVNYFLTEALPLADASGEYYANQNHPEIQKSMLGFSLYMPAVWGDVLSITEDRFNNAMMQAKEAYQKAHQKLHKSRSLDGMSEVEKLQFLKDEFLPAMKQAALDDLAKRKKLVNDTMAYVDKAKKQRARYIVIRNTLIILFLFIVFGFILYLTGNF